MWFQIEDVLNNKALKDINIQQPNFFNTVDYKWSNLLSDNYKLFLEEFEKYIETHKIKAYFNNRQAEAGKWKTLPLITWNIKRKNLKYFPITKSILEKIPGIVSASYSLLEAGGEISKHRGDTDAHIRTHICLYTSKDFSQAAFTVNNETSHWLTGQCLLFCDAHFHSGYNHSSENRLVMIIDVLHSDKVTEKNTICAKVLAGLSLNLLIITLQIKNLNHIVRFIAKLKYWLLQYLFKIIFALKIRL